MTGPWWCWRLGASTEWNIVPSACNFGVDLLKRWEVPVSWRQVAPDFDLWRGRRFHTETSTFLRRHRTWRYGWRKFSFLSPVGCKAELMIRHRSSEWCCAWKSACIWVRNLQPIDKHEFRDVLTIVRDFGKLELEEVDIWFEANNLSHPDGEKMIVVLLDLLTRIILSEERFGYLFELQREQGSRD